MLVSATRKCLAGVILRSMSSRRLAVKSLSGKIVLVSEPTTDVLDEIEAIVRARCPGIDVSGLPITGRILRLARFLESGREQALEPFGLTLGDFDMLATLRRRADDRAVNIRELQRSLMLSSGGTTKRLDRLESAGYIDRLPDPTDRRGTLIALSASGFDLIDAAMPAVARHESAIVAGAVPSLQMRDHLEAGLRRLLIAHETDSRTGD